MKIVFSFCLEKSHFHLFPSNPIDFAVCRMLHWTSGLVKGLISIVSFIFFVNHFAYLSVGRFDYQYNMKANILTGKFCCMSSQISKAVAN